MSLLDTPHSSDPDSDPRTGELLERLEELRQHRFAISVDTTIKATRLLSRTSAPVSEWTDLLCPLIARGPEEQERFRSFWQGRESKGPGNVLPASAVAVRETTSTPSRFRAWAFYFALLALLVVLLALITTLIAPEVRSTYGDAQIWARTALRQLPWVARLPSPKPPLPSPSALPSASPPPSHPTSHRPFNWLQSLLRRLSPEFLRDKISRHRVLELAIGILCLVLALGMRLLAHLLAQARYTISIDRPFALELRVPSTFRRSMEARLNAPQLPRALAASPPGSRRRIDVRRTVDSTLRKGGFPSVHFSSSRAARPCLLLIERRQFSDVPATRFENMSDIWKRSGDVAVYYYSDDPRLLRESSRARTGSALRVSLDSLMNTEPDRRLIVVGTGDGFYDPLSGTAAAWAQARLGAVGAGGWAVWPERLFLSTVPPVRWSRREVALSRLFDVLPADTSNLRDWLQYRNDPLPALGARLLQRQDAAWQAIETAASSFPMGSETDLATLEAYLGPEAYRLLLACALPAMLEWDRVLFFLSQIESRSGDVVAKAVADERS